MSNISTTVNHGITLGSGGYTSPLTVTSTGTINNHGTSGSAIFGGTGTVVNAGDITATNKTVVSLGTPTVSYYSGVYLTDAGSYLNNSGTIWGGRYAARLTNGDRIVNSGTMYGGRWGITSRNLISITNSGAISGGSEGIVLSGGGFINNSGHISGADGIGIGGAAGTVDNSGTITSYGAGVGLGAGGVVSNTGTGLITITGSYAAIDISGGAGAVINGGKLSGFYGVKFSGTYNNTLTDTGTLVGTSGTAVVFGSGNDLMRFNPSGSIDIQGTVDGGGGTNTLELGSGATAGTLTGLGIAFTNFTQGTVDSGAQWTLAGTNTIGSGFTLTDSGTLTDSATLVNAGRIAGATNGVVLIAGAQLTNQSGATIVGSTLGISLSGAGTVVNAGYIGETTASGTGIFIGSGGTVTNKSGGTIGGHLYAVSFASGHTNLLAVAPGAVFSGAVKGGDGTIEFASAASTGTLSGLGTSITNFGTLVFDAGARWLVKGNDSANGLGTLGIHGFTFGDTIDLTGIVAINKTFASNTLVVGNGAGTYDTLAIQGAFSSASFKLTADGTGGTDIVICFARDTLIDTPDGEVPVQKLAVGDLVKTMHNGPRAVRWIGTGKVLATRGRRSAATPVIVCKGALGPNLPHYDLRITKAHSLYIDGVLIPVEFLVNHRTIVWDDRAREVEVYHVELESHDILIANGVPAESYRDDGNRWLFRNANSGWGLPPQTPYAPVLTGGPVVDAIWDRFLRRAGPRSLPPMTDDPDLHLIADGVRIDACEVKGALITFRLATPPRNVRIVSRDAVPAELGIARDARLLGVALLRMVVRQGERFAWIEAEDDRLTEGFHAYEPAESLRWTNGDAGFPMDLFVGFEGEVEVVLTLGGKTRYVELAEAAA